MPPKFKRPSRKSSSTDLAQPQPFESFELLIGEKNGRTYPVTVIDSPAGEASGKCRINPHADEILDALEYLEKNDVDEDFLVDFGNYLFEELFAGDVAQLFRTSLGMARGGNARLRVRLRIDAPELDHLPWEYLYDAQEDFFLAISPETSFIRYTPMRLPARPTSVTPPLRILLVISNPNDAPPLNVMGERTIIENALENMVTDGKIVLDVVERATISNISEAMGRVRPHVFHFIGHGQFENEKGFAVLENESGGSKLVDEQNFREFFLGTADTRLAILNACQSATASSSRPLAGLAPNILQRKLAGVVAMQYEMPDRAAIIFSRELYRYLANGYAVDAAVAAARKGVYMEIGRGIRDWGTPILFLRAKDGALFDVASDEEAPATITVPPPPEPQGMPPTPNFVGREKDIEAYQQEFHTDGMVVITGLPGLGKTSLAVKVLERVAVPEKVFWHAFSEGETVDVLVWKLAGFFAWHGSDNLWKTLQGIQLSGGSLPPLEVLFDYTFQELSGSGYTLVFDDFQRVEENAQLEQFLTRLQTAIIEKDVTAVIISHRVPVVLGRSKIHKLWGLEFEDSRELMLKRGITLEGRPLINVCTQTQGNPRMLNYAIDALLRTANPEKLVERLLDTDSIERFLIKEVDDVLTRDESETMSGVAILMGLPGTRDAIETAMETRGLRRALRELADQHLLAVWQSDVGREYQQPRGVLHEFYYDLLSRRRRRTMHTNAADYYENDEPNDLKSATHYYHAGEYERSAEIALLNPNEIIFQGRGYLLRRLLRLYKEDMLPPETWVQVLLVMGDISRARLEIEAAEGHYREALSRAEMLDDSSEKLILAARACRGMALLLDRQSAQEAMKWVNRGLTYVDASYPADYASLQIVRSGLHLGLGNYEEGILDVEKGLGFLSPSEVDWKIIGLLNQGALISQQGDLDKGTEISRQAYELAKKYNNPFKTLIALSNIGSDKLYAGDWKGAWEDMAEAVQLAEQVGNKQEFARLQNNLADIYLHTGELALAEISFEKALSTARETGMDDYIPYILTGLTQTYVMQKDWERAQTVGQEAEETIKGMGLKYPLNILYAELAEVEIELGNLAQAEEHANESLKLSREMEVKMDKGISLRAVGKVAAANGDTEGAEIALMESLANLDESVPYERGLSLLVLGKFTYPNDKDKALAYLGQAKAYFEKLEAAALLAEIEELEHGKE